MAELVYEYDRVIDKLKKDYNLSLVVKTYKPLLVVGVIDGYQVEVMFDDGILTLRIGHGGILMSSAMTTHKTLATPDELYHFLKENFGDYCSSHRVASVEDRLKRLNARLDRIIGMLEGLSDVH